MRSSRVTLLCFAVLLLAVTCSYADKSPIDVVIGHVRDMANKPVTVSGVVSNSTVVQPNPTDDVEIKGEFDLTDKSGTIHVRTTGDPPANGIKLSVTGTLDASTDPPMIVQTGRPDQQRLLIYAALGLLVVLAIVLVVLLAKKPNRDPKRPVVVPLSPPKPIQTASTGVECPSCHSRNPSDAKFCENCSARLKGDTAPPRRVIETTDGGTTTPPPSSSGIAMADLTVVETPGKQLNARFELTKDGKGVNVGRNTDMTIRIQGDDTVSKDHARIWWSDGDNAFYIQDENSSWGTKVNGQKVSRVALNDNDEVLLGKTKLVFRVIGAQASGSQTAPPPSV
jgi:hypothetical protein